jgi:hypothetical protein
MMARAIAEREPAPRSQPVPVAPPKPGIDKVTLYLPKAVHKFIKQTALDLDRRPHDILMEGVEHVLKRHGKSLKDFGR